MRLLMTNMALVQGSGTIRYLQDLAPGLRDRGIECSFYAPRLSQAGISLDELGSPSNGARTEHPETKLPEYDIVFAKARCAMEAMATGAYVVIVGEGALGPSISSENIAELRQMNFGRENPIAQTYPRISHR